MNTARGDRICEQALLEALEGGHVAAAGLDVFHDEWDPALPDHPLHRYAATHDNLILTPHIGGASLESIAEARIFVAGKLAAYLAGPGDARGRAREPHSGRRDPRRHWPGRRR